MPTPVDFAPLGHAEGHREAVDAEFQRDDTHRIALWPDHRLLADSLGLGWQEVYTSLAAERPWSRTLHALPHVALAYCVHRPASIRRRIEGEGRTLEAELRPRTFGTVPADRDSHYHLQGNPDIQLVYLHRQLIDRVAMEAFDLDPARLELSNAVGFADPLLEQLSVALLRSARTRGPEANPLYAGSLAHMMAVQLLQAHATRPMRRPLASAEPDLPNTRRMRHVCDFIESTLDADLSIPRLAAEAGLSAHAFAPAFTRAMGVTPHGYVLERRVERAKQLLRGSDLPIAEIAVEAGFASQSHLSSVFKRTTGVTPATYRQ